MKKTFIRLSAALFIAVMLITGAPALSLCENTESSFAVEAQAASLVGKVSKLTAEAGTTSIKLSWKKALNATGYCIYQRKGSSWKALGKTTSLSCNIVKLNSGREYTFAVRAYNIKNGKVTWAGKYATVKTATTAPAPAKIVSSQNASAIKLTWTKCEGADGYRIYYKSQGKWKAVVKSTAKTTHTFKNLAAGARYTFAVRPYTKTSFGVVWGKYTTHDTASKPAAPTVKISAAETDVSLSWNSVKGATGYRIYYKTNKNADWKIAVKATSKTAYAFKNLVKNKTYFFAVRPYIKTSSAVIWGTYTSVSAVTKAQSGYLIDRYNKVFQSGCFLIEIEDSELGPVTMAIKNGNMYVQTSMEGMSLCLVYHNDADKWYVLIDSMKKYSEMPGELLGDMSPEQVVESFGDENNKIVSVEAVDVESKLLVCETFKDKDGNLLKYYFDGKTLVRSDIVMTDGYSSTMYVNKVSSTVSDELFEIPEDYDYWNLKWLMEMA